MLNNPWKHARSWKESVHWMSFLIHRERGNKLVSSERKINAFQFKPPAGGPVREPRPRKGGKRYRETRRGGGGSLVRNGAWSGPSCSAARLLQTSSPRPHCRAKCGEGWRANLKQSKFRSFHTLVASLAFNWSQWSPKEAEVTGGRGEEGEGEGEGESPEGTWGKDDCGAMVWKWRLNHHVSSLSFSLTCKQTETNRSFCSYFPAQKSNSSHAEADTEGGRRGQRRHLTNADLSASKHTFTCTPTSTSSPCRQASIHLSLSAFRFFLSAQHQRRPDQRVRRAQGSSLSGAVIKTEVMF